MQVGHASKAKVESKPRRNKALAELPSSRNAGMSMVGAQADCRQAEAWAGSKEQKHAAASFQHEPNI